MKDLVKWSKLTAVGFIHSVNEYSLICSYLQSQEFSMPDSSEYYRPYIAGVKSVPQIFEY